MAASILFSTCFFKGTNLSDLGVFQILCGFCAVLGHTYLVFSEFKGGRGVASLAGMIIASACSPHLHGHIHSYGDPDRVYFRWVNYSQRIFTCNFADIPHLWL